MPLPYIIWAPPYNHASGGIRALYKLKDELKKRGFQASMSNQRKDTRSIVVYPEIVTKNPLRSRRYIRWLLNKKEFPNDICYAWESGMGTRRLLTVDIIEKELWIPTENKTDQVAFWVGKGIKNDSLIPKKAIEISRYNYQDREKLAYFVSTLDYLISFDPFSSLNLEAILAGTPVLLYPSGNWSKKEIEGHGWIKGGIAWHPRQLNKARDTMELTRINYEKLIRTFDARIDRFAKKTQELFENFAL